MLDKQQKQKEVERLFRELSDTNPKDEDYEVILKNLQCLMKEEKNIAGFSKDELIKILGNILSILTVLHFERTDTIVSKAFSMIRR